MLEPPEGFTGPGARKRLVLIGLVLAIAVAVYLVWLRGADRETGAVRVSGNIEVTEAEVSFKLPGKVAERLVSEGETVQAGQVVARLENAELTQEVASRQAEVAVAQAVLAELVAGSRPEEIAQAEAAARVAQARLDEMLAGSRPEEIAAAEAAVEQAVVEADRWRAEYERYQKLLEEGVVSAQQFDAIRAAYAAAEARHQEADERFKLVQQGPRTEQIEQARAAAAEANERYALIKAGPRKETIEQARARMEQARQALEVAKTRLGYATLISPLAGVVLSENVEAGEYVAAGTPVVTVGDLANVWLRAYINETDLGRVKVGQPVRLTGDTFPGKSYEGRVSFLASQAEFTPKTVQTEQERVKLVYRVKIDVPNPQMELKPGMPADAEILLSSGPAEANRRP